MKQKLYAKGFLQEVKENGTIRGAVASTGATDRQGEIIEPAGWILDQFKNAPRLLWSHMAHELPIGKVTNIHLDQANNNLVFDAEFAEKENDFAKKVADLMRGGFINTFSVGFRPIEWEGDRYIKQELLEISVVNVPANAEARLSAEYKSFETELAKIKMEDYQMKPEPDVTENYIRIRVEDPDKFVSDSFRTITISADEKIKAIIGKYKDDPNGPTHVQSYLFDKDKWSVDEAQAWVREHEKEWNNFDFTDIEEIIDIIQLRAMIGKIKEGRVISEKNRTLIRVCIDSMNQASEALRELLKITEPAPKGAPKNAKVEDRRADKILKALRLVDKAAEFAIQQIKK